MRVLTVALVLVMPRLLFAQDTELMDKEQTTVAVNSLSRCVAVYEVAAQVFSDEKPATAEAWHQLSNGARMAATYLLAWENIGKGNPPKPYGDFNGYVDSVAEPSTVRLLALLENEAFDVFQTEMDKCVSIHEMQSKLVQMVLDELEGR